MCSSSQNKDSTSSRGVNESSVTDDVKRTASRENGQMTAGNPKKDVHGEGLKFREIKVCDKDVSVAQETFPEFFCQRSVDLYQDIFAAPQTQTNFKDITGKKQNPQSECGGLVLWYIREYGLKWNSLN